MWNSNLPKSNAIYIFGSYGLSDVTFFLGKDVLSMEERTELISFFENNAKRLEKEFRKEMRNKLNNMNYKFDRGFDVYIRTAYEQNKNINKDAKIDYFSHIDRIECENNVIEFCRSL